MGLRHSTFGLVTFVQRVHQALNIGEIVKRDLVGFEAAEIARQSVVYAAYRSPRDIRPFLKILQIRSRGLENEGVGLSIYQKSDERRPSIRNGLGSGNIFALFADSVE